MSDKFKVECGYCGATGLYKGFAEPIGFAVICYHCGGKGYSEAVAVSSEAKLFTHRKRKEGVQRVLADSGMWMLRTGTEKTISIADFEKYMEGK